MISGAVNGDVEKEGEEELLWEELERADILKAAHHGSKNSTSNEFYKGSAETDGHLLWKTK